MIVFSGHIANWEIAMLAGVQYGISVAQIYRAGNNPLLDRMITRFRGHGGELIPKGAVAAGRAIEALRCGTHAPAYSARRSATAKKLGLGRRRQIVKETPRRRSRSKARTASATS